MNEDGDVEVSSQCIILILNGPSMLFYTCMVRSGGVEKQKHHRLSV